MNDTPVFSQWLSVTENLVDCFGRLKPSALLYAIQDISGAHSDALGTDYQTLSKKDLFWAVIRTRVEISRLPRLGEKIRLTTWPMPTSRVAYPRAVAAFDEDDRELFRSVSLWVLMEGKSRNMVLPKNSGVEIMGSLTGLELPTPQGLPARLMPRSRSRSVCFTDLDRNSHMNNTRYLDWICDLLPGSFHQGHELKDLTICYMSEAREGQELVLHWDFPDSGSMVVDITRDNGDREDRIFGAKLLF